VTSNVYDQQNQQYTEYTQINPNHYYYPPNQSLDPYQTPSDYSSPSYSFNSTSSPPLDYNNFSQIQPMYNIQQDFVQHSFVIPINNNFPTV